MAIAARRDPLDAVSERRLLKDRATHDLGYRADVLADLATEPVESCIVVLTGPRRVGKSVALLDLAHALCARIDVHPLQVIYLACDGMSARDLRRSFTLGRDVTRAVDRNGATRRVWLLDEITTVNGWTATLKAARDGTPVGEDTVVVTGSRWRPGEDVEGNLLAGRAGATGRRRVRHLLPMTFRDFVLATRPELAVPERVHPAALQSPEVRTALDEVRFEVDRFDLAWQDYLTCGGFPRAVAEHVRLGAVTTDYLRDLAAWLRRDVDPDAAAESVPLLLAELARRASSPLNITNLADVLPWPRAGTDVRLHRLISSFGALWCRQRDTDGYAIAGSQPKCYLVDPLLAWLPHRLRAGLATPDMTQLNEQALGVALARAIDNLDEGRLVAGDTIGYARTETGNDVDLAPVAVPSPSGTARTTPIESKWVDNRWRSEARVIENKYGCGILATKSILDLDHPTWAVPAPLIALLLG